MKIKNKLIYISCLFFCIILVACNQIGENAEDTRVIDDQFLEAQQNRVNSLGEHNQQGMLSSESTTIPSTHFPHTRAIQITPAQYEFIIEDLLPENFIDQIGQHPNLRIPQLPGQQPAQPGEPGQQPDSPTPPGKPAQPEGPTPQPDRPAQPEAPTPEPAQPEAPTPTPEPAQPRAPQEEANRQPEQGDQAQPAPAQGISDIEQRVIELTNIERRNNGLADLQVDTSLSHVAREKSNDMQANNYFSHTSPTYGSPFDMIRDFGVSYNAAAENIAMGQQTSEQVVQAWMDSPGHRQNILNGTYTHIGVGYNENGHYWTQMFISR